MDNDEKHASPFSNLPEFLHGIIERVYFVTETPVISMTECLDILNQSEIQKSQLIWQKYDGYLENSAWHFISFVLKYFIHKKSHFSGPNKSMKLFKNLNSVTNRNYVIFYHTVLSTEKVQFWGWKLLGKI